MPLILAATRAEASELCVRFPKERVHCIGVGKVASALAAQRIILEHRARAVLLAGVSGGIAPCLQPLDTLSRTPRYSGTST